jgi:hypothetical protein
MWTAEWHKSKEVCVAATEARFEESRANVWLLLATGGIVGIRYIDVKKP